MFITSEKIDEVTTALHGFQSELVTVEKSVTNPFFKRKYADLSSIMVEALPILNKHGLVISQFPDELNGEPALTTILAHSSGQFMKAVVPLPIVKKGDPQEYGRAITYMRRYGFSAVTQIVIDEDDDGNQSSVNAKKSEKPNPSIAKEITDIWIAKGATQEQLMAWVAKNNNGEVLENLPESRQQAMLTLLKNKQSAESSAQTEKPGE